MNSIPEDIRRRIEDYGATIAEAREMPHATRYELVHGAERAILDVYHTGKVLEGGKQSPLRELLREGRFSAQKNTGSASQTGKTTIPAPNPAPRIGTDEAGKGEYLGPLVVAGVRVLGAEQDRKLREIGVRDSKTLGPEQALRMAAEIEEALGAENLRVVALSPGDYETRREAAGNVNRLLGELNSRIINELEAEVEGAIVDAFGKKARSYIEPRIPERLRLEVRPRAEDDAAVAAASILARARYLKEMDKLSDLVGFELPRGSTHVVEAARRVVEERGPESLAEVAKTHFATTRQVLGSVKSA